MPAAARPEKLGNIDVLTSARMARMCVLRGAAAAVCAANSSCTSSTTAAPIDYRCQVGCAGTHARSEVDDSEMHVRRCYPDVVHARGIGVQAAISGHF